MYCVQLYTLSNTSPDLLESGDLAVEVVYLPAQLPLHARLALLLAHVAMQLHLGALLAQLGRDR